MTTSRKSKQEKDPHPRETTQPGLAGELHQTAGGEHPMLTTNQGLAVSDNQNSLRAHPRGPTLLEDFVLREKIMHDDGIVDGRLRSLAGGLPPYHERRSSTAALGPVVA